MKVLRNMIGDAADISWSIGRIPNGTKYKVKQTDWDVYEVKYWEEVEERILQCEQCGRWFISAEQYFCCNECADEYWDVYYDKMEGNG